MLSTVVKIAMLVSMTIKAIDDFKRQIINGRN